MKMSDISADMSSIYHVSAMISYQQNIIIVNDICRYIGDKLIYGLFFFFFLKKWPSYLGKIRKERKEKMRKKMKMKHKKMRGKEGKKMRKKMKTKHKKMEDEKSTA